MKTNRDMEIIYYNATYTLNGMRKVSGVTEDNNLHFVGYGYSDGVAIIDMKRQVEKYFENYSLVYREE
jgi:hypothetical protein